MKLKHQASCNSCDVCVWPIMILVDTLMHDCLNTILSHFYDIVLVMIMIIMIIVIIMIITLMIILVIVLVMI